MTLPTISVVVPSYNQARWLEEAITSVLAQDVAVELIVMDGGSTDGSVEVIRRYEDRITYWQSQPDGGQTMAIREGFRRATGDVLGWLNSDDALCQGALRAIAEAFATDPSIRWLYGDGITIDEDSRELIHRPNVQIDPDDLFNLHIYLPQECTYFRRDLYFEAGEVDPALHYAMDYDLWLRLAALAPPRHLRTWVGKFRVVAGQKSSDIDGYVAEEEAVKARHAEAFRVYGPGERVARVTAIRGARLARRTAVDGPAGVIQHAVRVARGGQVSPGSTPTTARTVLALVGGAVVAALATIVAIGRRRR